MLTKDYQTIQFSIEEEIGYLTISREKNLNALNSLVLSELRDLLENIIKANEDFSLKGIIVSGAGEKAFIAGADIKEMDGMSSARAREFGELGQEVTFLFERLSIPVIACVHGFALGGGCEMAMASDFIYATEAAVFGQPEVKLGLIPGFGGTQRLARLIGRNRAKELIYTGRNISAEEAFSLGLVVKVFKSKEEMLEGAKKTLGYIKKVSPHAVKVSKEVMNTGNDLTLVQGLNGELEQFSAVFSSEDMKEGAKAFIEKRTPCFTGK